jgi:hypothetical protein
MSKIAIIAITILFALLCTALLMLSCEENDQDEQTLVPEWEICDSSCEEFVHSTIGIDFINQTSSGCGKKRNPHVTQVNCPVPIFHLAATKIETGALIEYDTKFLGDTTSEHLKIKLNTVDWQNFLRALYICKINEWEKNYISWRYALYTKGMNVWKLEILSSNKEGPNIFQGESEYPPNWREFEKVMNDMKEKIEKEAWNK